jgi:hypothetical protein
MCRLLLHFILIHSVTQSVSSHTKPGSVVVDQDRFEFQLAHQRLRCSLPPFGMCQGLYIGTSTIGLITPLGVACRGQQSGSSSPNGGKDPSTVGKTVMLLDENDSELHFSIIRQLGQPGGSAARVLLTTWSGPIPLQQESREVVVEIWDPR